MIEQRSILELLNDDPVTETVTWIDGEPRVQDVLRDPVVHAVLRRDGLTLQDLTRAIARGRGRLAPPAFAAPGQPGLAAPRASIDNRPASDVPASDGPASDGPASGRRPTNDSTASDAA